MITFLQRPFWWALSIGAVVATAMSGGAAAASPLPTGASDVSVDDLATWLARDPAFLPVVRSLGYQTRGLLGQTCGLDEDQILEFGRDWSGLLERVRTEADLRYAFKVAGLDSVHLQDLLLESDAATERLTAWYPELDALSPTEVSDVIVAASLRAQDLSFFVGACGALDEPVPPPPSAQQVTKFLDCVNRARVKYSKCVPPPDNDDRDATFNPCLILLGFDELACQSLLTRP